MFDEIAKARDIFWEEFQGTGMDRSTFDILFNSSIDKIKCKLTSQSSGRDNAWLCPKCLDEIKEIGRAHV